MPLNVVVLVIVAIGANFGASVKTVALLKKLGVKHIYARAADDLHYSILEGLQIDRIITPEQRAARDLSLEMALGHHAQVLAVTHDDYALRFGVPDMYVGSHYSRLQFPKEYNLKLIAACRPIVKKNVLGITSEGLEQLNLDDTELRVEAGDIMLCYGSRTSFIKMIAHRS